MKTRHFYLLCGVVATFGVASHAQVINPVPARVFGQVGVPKTVQDLISPASTAVNLLEGRELYGPVAIAIDARSSPAMIYVVDAGNNRVLGWKDYSTYTNGGPADVVLGQKDMRGNLSYAGSFLPTFGSGLYAPAAVAVDKNGNVFVMDSGNNRILRYPTPAVPPENGGPILADLVIGQPNLSSGSANRGAAATAAPDATCIRTNSTTTQGVQSAGIAFDASGNLWLADAGNHRILRYPASAVSGSSNTGTDGATVRADYVLGQLDFNTNAPNPGRASTVNDRINKLQLRFPNAIAFDASGNLFAIDDLGRVLVFQPPFEAPGQAATRILGIYSGVAGQPLPPPTNDTTLGTFASNNILVGGPRGIFTVGDYIFVCDTANNRVVRWDPVSTWAPEGPSAYSPKMTSVFGQDDFNKNAANNGARMEPSANYLDGPVAAAYLNAEIYMVDSRNNRVLILPYNTEWNFMWAANRVLGQIDFPFRAANLIEGREFGIGTLPLTPTTSVNLGIGMAIDATTPGSQRLYIADTGNHRILGYSDARKVQTGDHADLVIGQPDFFRSVINYGSTDPLLANESGLASPSSVLVDAEGNLWVADTGNGRVLRFPKPFDNPAGPFVADLVIGQPDFATRTDGVVARNRLFRPVGLALTFDGHLVVSDIGHHRVLLYRNLPFSNGQAADVVLGQPDGETGTSGNSEAKLNLPMGVAIDTDDRLYVADTLNSRLSIFDRVNAQTDGANAALMLPSSGGQPQSVTVSARTGQIYVPATSGGTSRVYRYPRFDQLVVSGNYAPDPTFVMNAYIPRSVLLDPVENLYIADSSNRITMHYPQLTVVNAMNAFPKVAPAMIGLLRVPGVQFTESGSASGPELPKELADVQVSVDGVASPMMQVDSETVRMIVPKGAPTSGLADFVVRRVSTGEILAYSRLSMTNVSPAVIFQGTNPGSTGQARAFNQDGGANGLNSAAAVGQELTVLLTGYGSFDSLPDDGLAPGPERPVPDSVRAFVRVGTNVIEFPVLSSTLDPDQPGVWRIKVRVPPEVNQGGSFGFLVLYKSVTSDSMTNPNMSVRPMVQVSR